MLKYLFVVLLFLGIQNCYSQINPGKLVVDTLETEEIIYEIDTVFLNPDTVNVLDTIIQFTSTQKIKKELWAFEMFVSPFISGVFNANREDSVSIKKTINCPVGISFLRLSKSLFYGFNIDYTLCKENFIYQNINNNNVSYISPTIFDSINYKQECNITNYYQLLGLNFIVGKIWDMQKFSIMGSFIFGGNILLKGNAYTYRSTINDKMEVPEESLRKYSLSFALSTALGYKINKKHTVFIAPYFKYNTTSKNKYPTINSPYIGIFLGFRKIF